LELKVNQPLLELSQPTTFGSQPTCNPVIIFLEEKEGLGRTENNWFFLCLFFTHISKIT
jgi:hypothetical protein